MDLCDILDKVILFSAAKHQGQRDKAGFPYILHPIEVMCSVETIEEKIVAITHDLIEDTDTTLEDLRVIGVPDYLLKSIDSVTKRYNESYNNFIKRASEDIIGIKVKLADIKHNTRKDRIEKLDIIVVRNLMNKYYSALDFLEECNDNK